MQLHTFANRIGKGLCLPDGTTIVYFKDIREEYNLVFPVEKNKKSFRTKKQKRVSEADVALKLGITTNSVQSLEKLEMDFKYCKFIYLEFYWRLYNAIEKNTPLKDF